MPSFKSQLRDKERWMLAFYVANFTAVAAQRARGAALWQSGVDKQDFPDIGNVATLSPNEVRRRFGDDAAAVQAYLRANPQALAANKPAPLDVALTAITNSVSAYRNGSFAEAQQLAVQAYLDGFELTEAGLQNVDAGLMHDTEHQMMALRQLMRRQAPVSVVVRQAARVESLLRQSKEALQNGTGLSNGATFLSALLILLREGLEALLVVAAIIAFLIKAERRSALPYVHVGWAGAIVLGLATWVAATYAINISGANREITEGATGLIAAAMLVYVGYWLHSKATARAWQRFIKERVGTALAKRTLWAMALISFLAVYREMFETVLFYQALWVQAGAAHRAFLGGLAAAVVALAAIAWAIFRYSVRLPLRLFFTATSVLLCVLAVVLAGKGVAALQEAGILSSSFIPAPSVPLLGIFPTLQGLGTQIGVVSVIIFAFWLSNRSERKALVGHSASPAP
jgi:high-affinity iron transporter